MARKIFLILLAASLLAGGARAGEKPFLTNQQIQKMDKGRTVYVGRILDDGGLLLLSQAGRDEGLRLIFVTPSGRVSGRIDVPMRQVEYAVPSPDGKKLLVYSQDRYSFYLLDPARKKWKLLDSRAGARDGFALFGGKKSRFFTSGGALMAWGYFYDRAGDYVSEWLVRLNLDREGRDLVSRVIEIPALMDESSRYYPSCTHVGFLKLQGRYGLFTLTDGDEGCLAGYDTRKGVPFPIEEYSWFGGGDISPDGTLAAYALRPRVRGAQEVLFVYDLASRLPVMALPGRFFNPVFDPSSRLLAVGNVVDIMGKPLPPVIRLVPVGGSTGKGGTLTFPENTKLVDWRFVEKKKLMVLTSDGDIFKMDL